MQMFVIANNVGEEMVSRNMYHLGGNSVSQVNPPIHLKGWVVLFLLSLRVLPVMFIPIWLHALNQ